MKIWNKVHPSRRFLAVAALLTAALPLFAGAAQQSELDALLRLKKGRAPGQSQGSSAAENGITQEIRGEYFVVAKGDLTIRMPVAYGLDNLKAIIAMLNDGLNREVISGKWEAVPEDGEGASRYVSFEFTETSFIVVENNDQSDAVQTDPLVYAGSYDIEKNSVVLGDFGAMQITDLSDGEMTFAFSTETDEDLLIKAKKTVNLDLSESETTNLLCRTWKLVRRNGEETRNGPYEDTIMFTKSGTYLVTYPDQALGLAQWEWVNEYDRSFKYSWDANGEESGIVQILQLDDPADPDAFVVKDQADVEYEFVLIN